MFAKFHDKIAQYCISQIYRFTSWLTKKGLNFFHSIWFFHILSAAESTLKLLGSLEVHIIRHFSVNKISDQLNKFFVSNFI